jgi:GPR1/FUN34/yaaH family
VLSETGDGPESSHPVLGNKTICAACHGVDRNVPSVFPLHVWTLDTPAGERNTAAALCPVRLDLATTESEGINVRIRAHRTRKHIGTSSGSRALCGNPAVFGLLIFSVGGTVLGISLLGYLSGAAQGGSVMPIIAAATGLGVLLTTVWAALLGQTFLAAVFGAFTGFWLSK